MRTRSSHHASTASRTTSSPMSRTCPKRGTSMCSPRSKRRATLELMDERSATLRLGSPQTASTICGRSESQHDRRRESAEGKRTFHSFRHTFAKRALESGCQITWLSRHLGHSSLAVTSETYGHWGDKAKREQVAQMEGVFGV